MPGNLTERTVKGVVTQVSLSIGLKILAIVKTFVFARIFAPDDFGIFATAGLVVSFVVLFGEMGINQAIIREKENPKRLMDTAFSMNILIAFLFFALIFAVAPVAAKIFDNPDLVLFIRFLSYSAFGAALTLPRVMWDREMRFGISKLPNLFSLIAAFIVTIVAALVYNFGTWSLFFGGFAGFIAHAATVWVIAPYRPHLKFELSRAKQLYSFGWPLLISSILGFIVWQGDDLMVRYFWGDAELGYYTIAFSMPMYLTQIVNLVSDVLFPAFSKAQDSKDKLEYAFTMSNKYLAIICMPIGIGIAIFAPQIIHYLYSDKWAPAVPVLQIFALAFVFSVSTGYNWATLVVSMGKTKYAMYSNLIIAISLVSVGYLLIQKYGMLGGAIYNLFAVFVIHSTIRLYIIKREFGNLNYLKSVYPAIISGCISGLTTYYIFNNLLVIYNIVLFLVLYLFLLVLFDKKLISEVKTIYKEFRGF